MTNEIRAGLRGPIPLIESDLSYLTQLFLGNTCILKHTRNYIRSSLEIYIAVGDGMEMAVDLDGGSGNLSGLVDQIEAGS